VFREELNAPVVGLCFSPHAALRAQQYRERENGSRDKKIRMMDKSGTRQMGVLIGKIVIRLTYNNTSAKKITTTKSWAKSLCFIPFATTLRNKDHCLVSTKHQI